VDREELLRVLRAFEAAQVDYVLIGTTAMGLHGVVRAAEDVDLMVRATAENVERLRVAFRAAYPGDVNVDDVTAHDLLGEYSALRYYPPSGDLYFDVLTRLGDAASFETVESVVVDVAGVQIRVATPAALYRLKRDTVRPIDRQDATMLRERPTKSKTAVRVQKFRSIEEMNAARVESNAADGFERFVRHCARYWRLAPRTYPRGVVRFRTIEDAQAARSRHRPDAPKIGG
jgi:hypothetical protein